MQSIITRPNTWVLSTLHIDEWTEKQKKLMEQVQKIFKKLWWVGMVMQVNETR